MMPQCINDGLLNKVHGRVINKVKEQVQVSYEDVIMQDVVVFTTPQWLQLPSMPRESPPCLHWKQGQTGRPEISVPRLPKSPWRKSKPNIDAKVTVIKSNMDLKVTVIITDNENKMKAMPATLHQEDPNLSVHGCFTFHGTESWRVLVGNANFTPC